MSELVPQPKPGCFDHLTRDTFRQFIVRRIKAANPKSSTMHLIEVNGCRAVVKDLSGGGFLFRTVAAPLIVRREAKALTRLDGVDGVPRLFRKLDSRALVLSYVEGVPCSNIPQGELGAEFFSQLEDLIARVHERGVAHGDLKTAQNIIRRPDGSPCLVDFGAAFWPEPGWRVLSNYLYRRLREVDWHGVYKLKQRHQPQLLTQEERRALEHMPTLVKVAHAYRRIYRWVKQRRGRN